MKTDFANEWINAWNSHDLEAIMEHYCEEIDFTSPIIQQMGIHEAGKISHKNDLRKYFSKGLEKYPDLHFELYHELAGLSSVVLFYRSINDLLSAEYMELNAEGKIAKVSAHYAQGV